MAALVARDIPPGSYVNLGIGQPTHGRRPPRARLRASCCTPRTACSAWARPRAATRIDPDLTNAGKVPVTELPGASYFHHADSFAMMRGGHLDVCVLGAFQVSAGGDLANWHTGAPDAIPAVGGAMDLAIGAKQVFVMMTLFAKDGTPEAGAVVHLPADRGGLRRPGLHRRRRLRGRAGPTVVPETFGTSYDELRERLDVPLVRGTRLRHASRRGWGRGLHVRTSPGPARKIGVEEELMLVDPDDRPADRGVAARRGRERGRRRGGAGALPPADRDLDAALPRRRGAAGRAARRPPRRRGGGGRGRGPGRGDGRAGAAGGGRGLHPEGALPQDPGGVRRDGPPGAGLRDAHARRRGLRRGGRPGRRRHPPVAAAARRASAPTRPTGRAATPATRAGVPRSGAGGRPPGRPSPSATCDLPGGRPSGCSAGAPGSTPGCSTSTSAWPRPTRPSRCGSPTCAPTSRTPCWWRC